MKCRQEDCHEGGTGSLFKTTAILIWKGQYVKVGEGRWSGPVRATTTLARVRYITATSKFYVQINRGIKHQSKELSS